MSARTANMKFDVKPYELPVIQDIARRAVSLANKHGVPYSMMDANMDIAAAHCNGSPLLLVSLRDADDFNFAHDVFGIRRHINRDTGKLENCFVPRFSARG